MCVVSGGLGSLSHQYKSVLVDFLVPFRGFWLGCLSSGIMLLEPIGLAELGVVNMCSGLLS